MNAQAAVGANNYELKKRRIAVTLADSRVRARNRFVLVHYCDNTVIQPDNLWLQKYCR